MKIRLNYRLLVIVAILSVLAIREAALEIRPSYLRPGLHLFAYVANTTDGTLSAIDLVKLAPAATIPVGSEPTAVHAHPFRKEIWGLSANGGYAWILDVLSNQIVARIPLGLTPDALDFSPNGKRAYVAASGSNSLFAIDCATRQVIARAKVGRRPWLTRVSPDGSLVVVSNHDDATVSVLDAANLETKSVVSVVPDPEQIVILPNSSKAFVSSGSRDEVSVVDLHRGVLLSDLELDGKPDALLLKPDGGELYISSSTAHGLLVVNTQTEEVAPDFIPLGMSPAAETLDPTTQTLYVSDSATGNVTPVAIDARRRGVPISAGQSPHAALLTPGGDMLVVVDPSSDELAVIRARTSSLITLIPTGSHPRDVAIKMF